MSELKTNLEAILQEKQDKIIPENIKKDVQIFDVIGTYEGSGSSTTGIKLFETQEKMQADSTAQEGDLAVVYRNKMQNMTADSQTQYITFPETVILPEAFTGNVNGKLLAIDSSVMFNGNIRLSKTSFRFDGFSESGMIRVQYSSSDGITYTRTRFSGDSGDLTNPVDLGTVIQYEPMGGEWDDTLGYFMQTGESVFEGVYSYEDSSWVVAPNQLTAIAENIYNAKAYSKDGVIEGTLTQTVSNQFNDTNAEVYAKIQSEYDKLEPRILTDEDKEIDKTIHTIPSKTDGTPLLNTGELTDMNSLFKSCVNLVTIPQLDTSSAVNMQSMFMGCTNLQNIPDLDTSKATNMSYMFQSCVNLTTIPLLDTSSATDIRSMFENCEHLMTVPNLNTSSATNMYSLFSGCASLTSIPLLDASNVTDVAYMFAACTNLVTIPQLDTSKVTNMMYMFMECTNLSDDSLNNVLAMCANATLYTGTKTLKYMGISEEQATKCTTLSNYEMFTSAGWTTGY